MLRLAVFLDYFFFQTIDKVFHKITNLVWGYYCFFFSLSQNMFVCRIFPTARRPHHQNEQQRHRCRRHHGHNTSRARRYGGVGRGPGAGVAAPAGSVAGIPPLPCPRARRVAAQHVWRRARLVS